MLEVPERGDAAADPDEVAVLEALVGTAVAEINRTAGLELLRLDESENLTGGIHVVWVESLNGALAGAQVEGPTCGSGSVPSGPCARARIERALVRITDGATVSEVIHELLHGLGLFHTCLVPSVMATEFSEPDLVRCGVARGRLGYTDPLVLRRSLSPYDIAALELVRTVSAEFTKMPEAAVDLLTVNEDDLVCRKGQAEPDTARMSRSGVTTGVPRSSPWFRAPRQAFGPEVPSIPRSEDLTR
jgi:hypothetical protein